jgi:hypothetical protein
VPHHFISTSYTDNYLEQSVVKFCAPTTTALTKKPNQVRNHLQHLREGDGSLLGVSGVNGDIVNSGRVNYLALI